MAVYTVSFCSHFAKLGVAGFYAGIQPTLIEIVPYIGMQFALYHVTKTLYLERTNSVDTVNLKPHEALVIGGWAGLVSKLATLPLDTIKKRLQVQRQFFGKDKYSGVRDVCRQVSYFVTS